MIELDLQLATEGKHPDDAQFRQWCELALRQRSADSEMTIRLVDEAEGRELNHTYRHKDYATNVLSFPMLERDELLAEVTVELADEVVTAPHRLPVRAGTSAAAAPLVP